MKIFATFIGIDKHLDAGIRELTGGRRDAAALHALFKDTMPAIQDSLLVDERAHLSKVRDVLEAMFSQATEEDTVIVSFSGHGTNDHRLVMHDSLLSDLESTTLSMEVLASFFKGSRARAVICILDCCFSGGAPAKVLENSPIARSVIGLQELAGEGRIIFAASKENEAAYELPAHRHGLLTKALIDALLSAEGKEDHVDLLSAGAEILDRVRAESGRLGVVQTPVFLGNIIGGLVFPRLKKGDLFERAFPEYGGVKVTSDIHELAAFGISASVLDDWASRFKGGLNALQLQAVNEHQILDGNSLLVVAPTSSGKTFIGELAAIKAIHEGRKAVFLLPYKALVNEKFEDFQASYGDRLGLRVVRCSGDFSDQTERIVRGNYDVALLTYEMFLNLSVAMPHILQPIGLVVVDEAQFITDPNRGINLELLMTNLISARERGLVPQIIALSAVIGDVNGFHEWLGTSLLVTYERPVPLREGVLDRSGVFQFKDENDARQLEQLLPQWSISQRKSKPQSQDVIVPLVEKLVAAGEKVLIFRNKKGSTQGCAQYLADALDLPLADDVLDALPESDPSSTATALRASLQGGTAFHNTNLNPEERSAIERSFRDPAGKVRVLVATTTLAAGINTPADTVIIAEMYFKGEEERPFTVSEYKNMAGRAGRLGYRSAGKCIVLAEHSIERDRFFNRYVLGSPETLTSSFDPNQIETWVVRLLAQVKRVPRAEVAKLLVHTFGGYLMARNNPDWQQTIRLRIEKLIEEMLTLGLLEEEEGALYLTRLGKACANSPLSFRSVLRLVESLRNINSARLSPASLMALTQSLVESDMYTPMMKKGSKEQVWPSKASRVIGPDVIRLLQRGTGGDEFVYYARAKRVSVLWDWISGRPLGEIEETHTVNPFYPIEYGNIRTFADNTRYLLRSVANIATLVSEDHELDVEPLNKQLEFGLPEQALGLLDLPVVLTRGEYLALSAAGLYTPEAVLSASQETLAPLLRKPSLSRLLSHRENSTIAS